MRFLKLIAAIGAVGAAFSCDAQTQRDGLEIPEVVEEAPRFVTSTDLIELREIADMRGEGLSLSPDGKYVAFSMHRANVEDNGYQVAWFVASTSSQNAPVRVDDGGDPELYRYVQPGGRPHGVWLNERAKWAPNSRGIAYRKRIGGETQVWWSARDGRESKPLTQNAADVQEFYWSADGSQIYFATDVDRAQFESVNEWRFRNGHVYNYDKEWSTINGTPYYPRYVLANGKPYIWILDVASQEERPATDDERAEFERLKHGEPTTEAAQNARLVAHREGQEGAAWMQADDPEKAGTTPILTVYASMPGETNEPIRCEAEACTGLMEPRKYLRYGMHWDSNAGEAYFVRREGKGYSKYSLYGWNVRENRVRKILTTHEWISDCSITDGRAICFYERPTYPRRLVAIDLEDGGMGILFDPNPEFRNIELGDVEFLEWENELGYESFGYLVKPPDYEPGRRYPLVFVGYRARGAFRGGTGDEYPVHLFAANGFAVLVYEKPTPHEARQAYSDPFDIGRARWGRGMFDVRMAQASFEAAVEMLDEEGVIDPDRVALTGLSAGSSHVAYSLIQSDLFSTAIATGGGFSPNTDVIAGVTKEFREYIKAIGAGRYPGPDGYLPTYMSLELNAEHVDEPLLLNVSDAEHTWEISEAAGLARQGNPVEMVVYPDEGHVKWHPAHRFSVYERNVDWLKFWLQNVEDPSPDKAEQYMRWRELRDKRETG